jgi:hypothetical protein
LIIGIFLSCIFSKFLAISSIFSGVSFSAIMPSL